MNTIAQYFHNLADKWEDSLNSPSPVQPTVACIGGVQSGSRVLDLGCGTGIMAPVYQQLNVGEAVCLDVAPRMIELAKEKYRDDSRLTFLCTDALAFKDAEGFDAVVIYNAYPHFLDRKALAAHVARLLKPSGRFVVAHSMGKDMLNTHHSEVPEAVTSDLQSAKTEAQFWEAAFTIDTLVDCPTFYCIAGSLK